MSPALDTQDEIYRFNTLKPIADPNHEIERKGFREIVLGAKEEDEEQDLWLRLRDEEFTWNNLYLGRSKTFKKGAAPKRYNVIVPIIPRCYSTPARNPADAIRPPKGWIYIIRQFDTPKGTAVELWRELASDRLGNFRDVNLKKYKGRDHRKATGQGGFRIIVPYCIDKKVHRLWIAFSEVQWSWARIQSLKKDSALRNQRMHRLDLSDCLDNFQNSNYKEASDAQANDKVKTDGQKDKPEIKDVTGPARLYNFNSAPDPESKRTPDILKDDIPVVYLDNPIGIARRLSAAYQRQWNSLNDCVTELRAMPDLVNHPGFYAAGSPEIATDEAKRHNPEAWFEPAALANRYFYSKIPKEAPPGVTDKKAYRKRLPEIEKQFIRYRNELDKPAIELALRKPQRTKIRDRLVRAREDLVAFLEKELATPSGKEIQDPPLVLALDDYFTLTPLSSRERKQNRTDPTTSRSLPQWRDNYTDGWQAVFDIAAGLAKHEYSLDADLEADPPDGWLWRRQNPAFALLLKLADPQGGLALHSRLFPKPLADDPLKCDTTPVNENSPPFKKQIFDHLEPMIRRNPDIIRGMALFGSNFSELMAMRDKKDSDYEKRLDRARYSLLRLVDSVFGLHLQETRIPLAELIERQNRFTEADQNGGTSLCDAFTNSVSFMDKTIDTAGKFSESAGSGNSSLSRIKTRVVIATNRSRTLKLLRDLGDNKMVTSSLTGFLALVEIHNFTQSLNAFKDNKNEDWQWKQFAPLAASFLRLPAAAIEVRKNLTAAASKTLGKAATNASQNGSISLRQFQARRETGLGLAGKITEKFNLIANLIDMGVTLSSFTENLAQHDDAAIADAMQFTGATLGLIGTVFSAPVLGWVAGLIGLAAWLAKAYLFTEDTPVEIWLANGPFARGEEYHEHFAVKRDATIVQVKDAQGKWVDRACTVYRYDYFEFLVDSGGILVHARDIVPAGSGYALRLEPFKIAPDGTVYLKANPDRNIPADIHVATIGKPFVMHPLLKPEVKPTSRKDGPSALKALIGDKEINWHHPHQAYLALADAVYRPRVTLSETYTVAGSRRATVTLKVDLPFFIPGKSKLYIDFEQKDHGKSIEHMPPDPNAIKRLQVGPSDYEIVHTVYPGQTRDFSARIRLDLYGDNEVQLPHEPLFCGNEIETRIDKNTVKGVQLQTWNKWISVEKKISEAPPNYFDLFPNPALGPANGIKPPMA